MKNFVKYGSSAFSVIRVPVIIGILWALTIGILWLVFRNGDHEGGVLNFLGRFHVLAVHLPVGILFLAVLLEIASRFRDLQSLRQSIPFVLWVAFLGGIAATVMGYLLMGAEETAGLSMTRHLWTGLAVVVFTLCSLTFFLLKKNFLYLSSLLAATLAVAAAGHFGGAMVHESDYLSEFAPQPLKPLLTLGLSSAGKETAENQPDEANAATGSGEATKEKKKVPMPERKIYADFVAPILSSKCTSCHDADKIKGKLRLDTYQLILQGAEGSDFPTVVPGKPQESEMIVRVTLDHDDDDFMPPKGDVLTPEEIKLLTLWIQSGAKTETTMGDLGDAPAILETANLVARQLSEKKAPKDSWKPVWNTLSDEEKQKRISDAMASAAQFDFSIMPISAEDKRLRVNVINASKDFGDEQLATLEPIAEQIAWLDLSRSQITDAGMKTVGHMRNLEQVHLENTRITEKGVSRLAPLSKLEYINLYGTNVGDGIFAYFKDMPHLKKLYLWQTKVKPATARAFERSVNLEINTGVEPSATAATDPE